MLITNGFYKKPIKYTMNPNEIKVCQFIATHAKEDNYVNNIVRNIDMSKSNVAKTLKSLSKSRIIVSLDKIDKKEVYLMNPNQRGLVQAYFDHAFFNLTNVEKIMNEDLDKIKNKSLFTRKDPVFWKYKNKKIEKTLLNTFKMIDSIFSKAGSLPFLQIAGFIEKNEKNDSMIQNCQNQTYVIIDKIIHRLKKEHAKDNDILDLVLFLNVRLVSSIMVIEGNAL
jgi:DNA-binding MarR family transcriptional regulator